MRHLQHLRLVDEGTRVRATIESAQRESRRKGSDVVRLAISFQLAAQAPRRAVVTVSPQHYAEAQAAGGIDVYVLPDDPDQVVPVGKNPQHLLGAGIGLAMTLVGVLFARSMLAARGPDAIG